jgi:A/G-specific adenine glycosylase
VLVSEVMLQQTQGSRVADRFCELLARFPTPQAMAQASAADVLVAWSGLGYNRRAMALQRAARTVANNGWPRDVNGLRTLPGVGPYTARSVAAIAFGLPVGAVDTNVRRWLIRRLGLADATRPADLQRLADGLAAAGNASAPDDEAATWMHASMEFGARICTARRPRCAECPIARGCPSRGLDRHVPVSKQAAFEGSPRAARGAIVRALADAPGHRLLLAALPLGNHGRAAVAGLVRDGLAHVTDDEIRLGGAPDAVPSTIGT